MDPVGGWPWGALGHTFGAGRKVLEQGRHIYRCEAECPPLSPLRTPARIAQGGLLTGRHSPRTRLCPLGWGRGAWFTSRGSPSLTVRNFFIHLKSLLASSPSWSPFCPHRIHSVLLRDCPAHNCRRRSRLQNFSFSLNMATSFHRGVSSWSLAQNQYCRWAVTHAYGISQPVVLSKKIAFPFKGHL